MFKKFLPYFAEEGGAGGGGTDPEQGGGAGAESGANDTKPEKTFTQAELDAIVQDRLARATKGMPGKEELEQFKAWKTSQATAEENLKTVTAEKESALAEVEMYQRKFAALEKNVPADKADRYVKLAESYLGADGDFEKALDAALKDFPVEAKPPEVPGSGGNPPPGEKDKTKKRPQGVVVF